MSRFDSKFDKFFDKCLFWFFGEHTTLIDWVKFFVSIPFMFVFMFVGFTYRGFRILLFEIGGYFYDNDKKTS